MRARNSVPTLRAVRAQAARLGASVDYTPGNGGHVPHDLIVDSPPNMVFRASGCHVIGGGSWWGTQADGEEVFASILSDLAMGVEPCEDPACEWCGN